MLECKIRCLGPQRGQLPWATQQMTIVIRMTVGVLRCRLLSKNLFRKVSVVHNFCIQLQVSHCYS